MVERQVALRIEEAVEGAQYAAAQAHQNAAQHEDFQTPFVDILTHRRSGDFIVANRPDHTAPRGVVGAIE